MLESEASSSHQRIEKPQSPSNHFRVVLTLRLPNPNRHLKNNYLSWISGIIWPFWTTTQFACHFLSWHLLSLCSCVKIAWARMKREGISTLHHAASRQARGALGLGGWWGTRSARYHPSGKQGQNRSHNHSPHHQSPKLQKCSCLHTKSKESFQSISGLREDFFPQKWMFCNAQADSHTENHSNMSSSKWQSLQLWHHAILEPKSWDEWISNESTYNTANMTWDYS